MFNLFFNFCSYHAENKISPNYKGYHIGVQHTGYHVKGLIYFLIEKIGKCRKLC
jgi:hypothetical protein